MSRFRLQQPLMAAAGIPAGRVPVLPGIDQAVGAALRRLWILLLGGFAFAGRLAIILLVIIGLGVVYDQAVGDGRLPRFAPLSQSAPQLARLVRFNSTAALPVTAPDETHWQAMAGSRRILSAVAPEIADWLMDLHRKNRIVFGEPSDPWIVPGSMTGLMAGGHVKNSADTGESTALLGAYRHMQGRLYLGRDFWRLSDGEKVCVLAHEYRHARQNLPKQVSVQLARVLTGRAAEYGSPIEDEAFLYEKRAYEALSLPATMISPYLRTRGLR